MHSPVYDLSNKPNQVVVYGMLDWNIDLYTPYKRQSYIWKEINVFAVEGYTSGSL